MSKRGEKAAAIREHIEQHPDDKATDIIKALAAKRIKVSPTQVYGIMSNSTDKVSKPAPAAPESNGQAAVANMPLIHAKQFIVASGGLEQARKVLDLIESLQLSK